MKLVLDIVPKSGTMFLDQRKEHRKPVDGEKTMKVNVKVMTIAIKFDFGWTLDTYARIPSTNKFATDKAFIELFEKEYQGNGIEEVKIVDSWENTYYNNTFAECEAMFKHLREVFENINETILNY